MSNEEVTKTEQLGSLAQLTVNGPECKGRGVNAWDSADGETYDCVICKGTGQVPKYPRLRKECVGQSAQRDGYYYTKPCVEGKVRGFHHQVCEGLGYTLDGSLEALVASVWGLGWYIDSWYDDSATIVRGKDTLCGEGKGAKALISALCAAEGI